MPYKAQWAKHLNKNFGSPIFSGQLNDDDND